MVFTLAGVDEVVGFLDPALAVIEVGVGCDTFRCTCGTLALVTVVWPVLYNLPDPGHAGCEL